VELYVIIIDSDVNEELKSILHNWAKFVKILSMGIEIHELKPAMKLPDGRWNLDLATIVLPEYFKTKESMLIYLPPNSYGGNHKHPRREAFIGTADLDLLWKDEDGVIHREKMGREGTTLLFIVQPNTPHLVVNTSKTSSALLYELADDLQHDVELVDILKEATV